MVLEKTKADIRPRDAIVSPGEFPAAVQGAEIIVTTQTVFSAGYGEGGVFYDNKSNEIKENTTDVTFKTELSGLRIPVMIGYHVFGEETGVFGLRAFGGGSAFILTSVSAEGLNKDDFTSPAYGVFLGFGFWPCLF